MSALKMVKPSPSMELVIGELEKSLAVMENNYQKAITNLSLLKNHVENDDLTKLLRRGAFLSKLQNFLDSSKRENREVQIMMIDVDRFKSVNDKFGHQTGDVVLERVSSLIKKYLRPEDLAGRYGGEEIIVAIQSEFSTAVEIAERIRIAVAEYKMRSADQREFNVTLSIGIASSGAFDFEAQRLIGRADAAMYAAKNEGRDRVRIR